MKKIFLLFLFLIPLLSFSQGKPKVDGIALIPQGAPVTPVEGEFYYDSTQKAIYVYNGTAWVEVGAGGGGGIAWNTPVDSNIIPDGNGTRDIGSGAAEFANIYADNIIASNSISGDGSAITSMVAGNVNITDPGAYFAATDVEGALQELGAIPPGGGTDDQIASEVPFTPAGNIAATDVQAALEEVDTEAVNISSLSPELNIRAAGGTTAQLDAIAEPPASVLRFEIPTDGNGDIATDFYTTGINLTGVSSKTLTLTRNGLADLSVNFDAGDMLTGVYDLNVDNIVDNSAALGGVAAANYLRSDQSDSMTGNLSITGTVDGRDVSVDGTKLDGIEASAKDDQIASEVPFTPTGTIAATDVQAAIAEVAAEAGGGGSGDMLQSTYDTNVNNIVDNSEALGGIAPGSFLRSDQSGTLTGNLSITGTVDGRDVSSDGTKLDGIEANATADQTAAEVAIADTGAYYISGTVEGALAEVGANKGDMFKSIYDSDADNIVDLSENAQLLDGINSPSFLRSDTNDSFTASLLTLTNGTISITTATRQASYEGTQISFNNSVNSTIANTGGGALLFSTDNATGTTVNRINIPAGVNTATIGVTGNLDVTGNIDAGGDITAFSSSDERLKYDINLIKNPVKKVQSLRGVDFKWKNSLTEMLIGKSGADVGVIAQDVEKVLPTAVREGSHGYKQVDYEKIIPLLIEAIKDQQEQIEDLKHEVKILKRDK